MIKLSVVVSAYNEEKNIGDCLESVKGIADEIIVIDNSSQDKTADIAKKYGAKVYKQPNRLMLNINKNYGFEKAQGEWILNLDGDERVTPELAKEIRDLKVENGNSDVVGYWIARKNIIFGKWIQNEMWWPDYQLRLFRKGKGRFAEKHVHEYIEVDGQTEKLKSNLLHYNYTSINQYIHKLETIYTDSEATNMMEKGYKFHPYDVIRLPASDFLKIFFAQKGYRDGFHGLVLSILQAFYSFIVVVKIWERDGFKEIGGQNFVKDLFDEFLKLIHEVRYWFLTVLIDETKSKFYRAYYKLARRRLRKKIKL